MWDGVRLNILFDIMARKEFDRDDQRQKDQIQGRYKDDFFQAHRTSPQSPDRITQEC
jgi:hypothetical protein